MDSAQRRALALIAGAQLLALSLWFSASAVGDSLKEAWEIDLGQIAWITLAVQIGFVVGALVSAVLNLADRVPARRLFVTAVIFGASVNAFLVVLGPGDFAWVLVIRFLTGAALAGVYPSGMKAVAGWFTANRGLALGVLIGALTVGSGLPHLVRGAGLAWQPVILASSVLAVLAAVMMLFAGDGPHDTDSSSFSWRHVGALLRHQGFRLATIGYLGHMWELYAAWTWIAAWIAASAYSGEPSTLAFVMIAIGGAGSLVAGRFADRRGRSLAAGAALVVSGTAAILTAVVFDGPTVAIVVVLILWGFSIVADSAQFSAVVTEVVDGSVRGTALTLQTALGFSLTLVTIWAVPQLAEATSWRWAFLVLVPGPVVGTLAMARLRRSDWAHMIAGGRG